ncbi:MAG: sulfotransferase [Planctomycetales bacterium]|nr:sulfotransferase [Planctomycetales bacterium]
MQPRIPFVYLSSLPYSGSTLLSFLVNAHPEIASVGEMTGLTPEVVPDEYLCSCGERIRECAFWEKVTREMQAQGSDFDPTDFRTRFELGSTPAMHRLRTGSLRGNLLEVIRDGAFRMWPGHQMAMRELGQRNERLARSILRVTGKRVFFDAAKYHMAIRYLTLFSQVDLKVVHLIRDVRRATNSLMARGYTLRGAVTQWLRGNRNIRRQLRHVAPEKRLLIRYEDLCTDTQGVLSRLFEFCGVDSDVRIDEFRGLESHIVGNKMRLSDTSTITLDQRWRTNLSASQLREIDSMVGNLHEQYGYTRVTDLSDDNCPARPLEAHRPLLAS